MTSLFCRHNRMTAKCPICSKELEAELRAKAPPRPAGHPPRARRPARPRALRHAARRRRRHAPARARGRRRLPQPARPRPARDRRRRAARRGAADRRRAARAARPVRRGRDRARPRAGDLARVPARARRPGRPRAPGRRARRRAALRGRRRCRSCSQEHARAIAAYRQWAERAGSQAAGFAGEADWSPQRRFARVFERLALPGLSRATRFELLADARRRRPVRARARLAPARRRGRRHDAGRQAGAAVRRQDAARAPRARPRRAPPTLPLAALDRGLALWDDPGAEVELDGGAAAGAAPRARARRDGSVTAAMARHCRVRSAVHARRRTSGRGRGGCSCSAASCSPRSRTASRPGPTYDPWAWIIWGREITEWDLDTRTGPVVEAAAGAVHDAVRARRRRRPRPSCG